jgi:hypothetical protein
LLEIALIGFGWFDRLDQDRRDLYGRTAFVLISSAPSACIILGHRLLSVHLRAS